MHEHTHTLTQRLTLLLDSVSCRGDLSFSTVKGLTLPLDGDEFILKQTDQTDHNNHTSGISELVYCFGTVTTMPNRIYPVRYQQYH